ncbi:MAG: TetR/AcrR family transcriptional regulator [Oscillospiraceae bacterium]|nr:TetR/AcrR family transcriptional regulator [Oscillospiraceae bacterium]
MKKDKRDMILDAAEELMGVMPDSDITVEHIAKKAGIGKGSVYYYFHSKDEIIDEVVVRSYKKALREYFRDIDERQTAIEKIKRLFDSMIKKEFHNNQQNLLIALNIRDNITLRNKMKMAAIETVAPVLAELLDQGIAEGTIKTDMPEESAEMIVATISFLFDTSVFPERDQKLHNKLRLLARVLETCLRAESGSFDFLFSRRDNYTNN